MIRGQDPPEKPSVIKTEALGNEETNVNQITIHDNAASDVITYNDANRRNNSTAGLSNNNHIGNTGNSEHKGQLKQQRPRVPRGIQGAVPTNSSRDFKNGGINSKMEKVENQDFFDDDDDILAAVADDDYFALAEDFDMEQIDQLEMGLQNNSHATANKQTTNSNMITRENEDIELPYDDEIFEDDFVEEDLLAEAADSFEIKPLCQRICNEESLGITHRSKNSRISNISSMEFSSHARNSSSTSNTTNIQTPSDVDFRQPKDANCTLNNVKTEPISQTNNSRFNSCSAFVKTGLSTKPKNTGALKRSSTKTNVTKSNLYSTRPSLSQASSIQIKKEPDNEVGSGCVNNDVIPMEDDTNHCQGPLVRDMHGPQGTCSILLNIYNGLLGAE